MLANVELKYNKEKRLLYVFFEGRVIVDNIPIDDLEIFENETIEKTLKDILNFMEDYLNIVGRAEVAQLNRDMIENEERYKEDLEGRSFVVNLSQKHGEKSFTLEDYYRMIRLGTIF